MDTVLIPTSPELTESDIQLLSGYAKQLGKARSLPRKAVRSGQNLSKKKGHGIELQEVRPYVASDEVRHMDWRVTARTGTPHTRVYTEDMEHRTCIICNLSKDAYFGTQTTFISSRLVQIAALIGWRHYQLRNPLGMITSVGHDTEVIPTITNWQAWSERLASLTQIINRPYGKASFSMPNQLKLKGTNVLILSDQLQIDDINRARLARLAQHNRVHWVSLEDTNTFLIPDGVYQFNSQNTTQQISQANRDIAQQRYLEQESHHQKLLSSIGITKLTFSVNDSPVSLVKTLLSMGVVH